MSIYEKNMQAVKKRYSDLYNKLIDYDRSNRSAKTRFSVLTSNHPSKYPNMYDNERKSYFYDNNDPINYIGKKIADKKIKLNNLNFLLGLGLGYELIVFLQKFAAKDSCVVVVEENLEMVRLTLNVIDLHDAILDQRVNMIIGVDVSNLYYYIQSVLMSGMNKLYLKSFNIIDNESAFLVNKDYYIKFIRSLKDAAKEAVLHFGNDPLDSLIGIENTFLNINEILRNPGIKDLGGKFSGRPGVVVATGPSLNKNVHLLKEVYGRAVICSADASVRVMKKYGFKPNIATSLERVIATSKLFEGLNEEDFNDIYFAACPVIRPETYGNFLGKRIIVYRNFATFKWLDIDKGILDIGPSAANMAFKVLEFLGCNPIILIGQDLAFGEDEVTHADGATFGEREKQYYNPQSIIEVEGNYQKVIKTSSVWYKFMKYYEKDVAEFNGEVINATEGGAKITGTKILTFREAIDNYIKGEFDISSIIESSLHYPTDGEIKDDALKSLEKVRGANEYCRSVIETFRKGIKDFNNFKEEIIIPYREKMAVDQDKSEYLFNNVAGHASVFSESDFYLILMHYVQSYYMKTLIDINAVRASDISSMDINIRVAEYFYDLYNVMIGLVEKMIKLFEELEVRLLANESLS